ncbi:BON domain-containing protein [Streptomyces sp. TE33382]
MAGIVSLGDLLGVFLREDEDLRHEIIDVLFGTLRPGLSVVMAEVRDGRVELTGKLPLPSMLPTVEQLCATVGGVVSVSTTRLAWNTDDALPNGRGGDRS